MKEHSDLAVLQVLHVPVGHGGKDDSSEAVLGEAEQRAEDQPLAVLPADPLQGLHVELDLKAKKQRAGSYQRWAIGTWDRYSGTTKSENFYRLLKYRPF